MTDSTTIDGISLANLNAPQRQAVIHGEGPLMVFAGAGSGKTRVITTRIARLIASGIAPWRILAMTFTNKAAAEMKQRVLELTPEGKRVLISTFHACCARWLREFGSELGFSSDFVIYDDKDATVLLKSLLADKCNKKELLSFVAQHKAFISWAKMKGLQPHEVEPFHEIHEIKIPPGGIETYKAYQQSLANADAMDFGDLMLYVLLLLRRHEAVRERLQHRYTYIMVDEFQDTNTIQFELICLLSESHQNVVVVGDDDQSIYSWRGANPSNIADFQKKFQSCEKIALGQNYRCSGHIVHAAAALITHNKKRTPKEIFTDNDSGEPIQFLREDDSELEGMEVAQTIRSEWRQKQFGLAEIAVFYRTNAQSRQLEESLNRENIPYTIYGSLAFYERMEVKDILAYIRLINNPKDDVSFLRIINVPTRGIGKKAQETILHQAKSDQTSMLAATRKLAQSPPGTLRSAAKLAEFVETIDRLQVAKTSDLIDVLAVIEKAISYKSFLKSRFADQFAEKVENIHELGAAMAAAYERDPNVSLSSWLESISLNRDLDLENTANGVTLMTLHMAKGLEFDRVFIVGVEDGLIPHQNSMDDAKQMEEERRLLYVGMTRARKKLSLFAAAKRLSYNQVSFNNPSRFLFELPSECLTSNVSLVSSHRHSVAIDKGYDSITFDYGDADDIHPLQALEVGNRVRHPAYGLGTIKGVEERFGQVKAMVEFDDVGLRKINPNQLSLSHPPT